jgi:hypothetical protein
MLVEAVREAAVSPSETDQYWAHFVDALGGNGSLLNGVLGEDRPVTNLQLSLILRRLSVRLASLGRESNLHQKFEMTPVQTAKSLAQSVQDQSSGFNGCYYGDAFADYNAFIGTTAFSKLMDYLSAHGVPGAESLSRIAERANLTAVAAKAIIALSMVDIHVTMDEHGRPLRRTRDMNAGEQRTLSAKLAYSTQALRLISCLRLPSNIGLGIDIDIPKSGDIEGALIQWSFESGGVTSMEALRRAVATLANQPDQPGSAIVQWTQTNKIRALIANERADADYVSNSTTDEDGHAEIGVEGAPQTRTIPLDAASYAKTFSVKLSIALQQNPIHKSVLNGLAIFLSGASPSSLAAAALDLYLGSRWTHSRVVEFDLRDWEGGNWAWAFGPVQLEWNFGTAVLYDKGNYLADIKVGFLCPPSARIPPNSPGDMFQWFFVGTYQMPGQYAPTILEQSNNLNEIWGFRLGVPDLPSQDFLDGKYNWSNSATLLIPGAPPQFQLSICCSLFNTSNVGMIGNKWYAIVPLRVVKACGCDLPYNSPAPCPAVRGTYAPGKYGRFFWEEGMGPVRPPTPPDWK